MSGILTALGYLIKEFLFLVSFVKNNAFPQPLSAADERKYLKLMAEGDPHARNMLIEHNLRLVAHIVKKFENTGEDSEDLISIGTIGLIKAIESLTEKEFVRFFTSTPYEIIAFIYGTGLMGDEASLQVAFEDLMQYINKAKG